MPQIKNQALRFVTFLVGTLSVIFLLIIFVISSKFYSFKEAVNLKQIYLSHIHNIEKNLFDLIDKDLAADKKVIVEKNFLQNMNALSNQTKSENNLYLINDFKNNWTNFQTGQVTNRQFINNARNILIRLEGLVEQEFIAFSLKYTDIQKFIILYSVMVFLFSAILLWIISRRWLTKVSNPLMMVSDELLRTGDLNSPLNLPPANYYEQDQLNKTLMNVWDGLRNLDYLKVKQIRAKNLKLQTILMSIDDIVYLIDEENRLHQANDQFLKEFNLTSEDIGKKWSELSLTPETKASLENINSKQNEIDSELFIKESGKTFYVRKRRIEDEDDGTYYGTLFMLEDITEGVEQQKVQKEFVAVLSHELKTPIQSLTTASELLSDFQNEINIPEYKIVTDSLFEDIRKVKTIAEDFVRFSKSEINTFNMNQTEVDLPNEIVSILEPLRLLIADKQITLNFVYDDSETYKVELDAIKFSWALSNIILNAYRVSPDNSQIQIKLSKYDGQVEVQVIDEGTGIDEEDQKAIFRPFYQGKKRGSFGLGLAIAKQVIDAHEGSLTYVNNVPHGAIFIIRLPLMESTHARYQDSVSG